MSDAEDDRLAADVAGRAGALLLALRSDSGLTGSELGKRGDLEANALILDTLAQVRPDDAVLSEESADSSLRLVADRVWIIDPLDGTREYTMTGRSDWAVHVALWERGAGITVAAVAQPALDAIFTTETARSALEAAMPSARRRNRPAIVVSDTRPPGFATEVAAAVNGQLATMGSAGAKAMAIVRGEADAYLHAGGQWEWDSAAPVGVAASAGLHTSRIDGATLEYNQPRPYLPDLLICRPELADQLLAAIAAATSGA